MTHLLWHYIVGPQFRLIVDSGVLLPDTFESGGHLACVWFGRDHFWERRSGKVSSDRRTDAVYQSNRDEIAARARGLGRIGVFPETLPHNRDDYRQMFWEKAPGQEIVYRSRMISSRYQRFSLQPVPIENWQAAQIWHEGTWVDVPIEKIEL